MARHAARQQQIGDVDAGNQQHESNRTQEQPEHLDALFGQKIVLKSLDIRAPALVALGIHLGDVGGDGVHVLLRLLEGDARLKAAHDEEPMEVVVDLFRLEDQGDRELRFLAIEDAGTLHADDGVGGAVHAQSGADDVGIGAQA